MALPWDKTRRGSVGKAIDDVSNKVGLNNRVLTKPLIGKKASAYVSKSKLFPFKGVVIAGTIGGPLAPIVAIKRWRAAGQIHPLLRAIGRKK